MIYAILMRKQMKKKKTTNTARAELKQRLPPAHSRHYIWHYLIENGQTVCTVFFYFTFPLLTVSLGKFNGIKIFNEFAMQFQNTYPFILIEWSTRASTTI